MDEERLPWLDEDDLARKHPQIFHYTNFLNLNSILSSGGLFGTPYTETNDREEFRTAKGILAPAIAKYAQDFLKKKHPSLIEKILHAGEDPENIINSDADTFIESALITNPYRPFLTCFSFHDEPHHKENGILAMWRSYCSENGGIALGFETKKISAKSYVLGKEAKLSMMYLDGAIYGHQTEILQSRLADAAGLIEMYAEFLDSQINHKEPKLDPKELIRLIILSACVKHADFTDEREIRLVINRVDDTKDKRPNLPMRGSKIVVPIADCLSHILIGPTNDPDAIEAAVQHNLRKFDRTDVTVSHSRTPYRRL